MSDMLFGSIPDSAFRVFVGRHARAAELVLGRLCASFFSTFASEMPEREHVKRSITAALVDYTPPAEVTPGDGEPADLGVEYFYARLRDAGWLIEEEDKWRAWVDMPVPCRRLLALLEMLRDETTHSFTGLISEVSSLVEMAADNPERYGTNIDGAFRTAVAFRQRMSEIDSGVAIVSRRLASSDSMDEAVTIFFAEFLGQRIADWTGVMTQNNPWRSRAAIVSLSRRIRRDEKLLAGVARAYVAAGHAADDDAAEAVVTSRLVDIENCFDDIERLRLRIEDRHRSVENRLGSILRYIGRNPGLSRQRIRNCLATLGRLSYAEEMPCAFQLVRFSEPFGQAVMAEARHAPPPAGRRIVRRRQPDPRDIAYIRARERFDRICNPSRKQILAWASETGCKTPENIAEWFMWRQAALLAEWSPVIQDGSSLVRVGVRAESKYGTTAGFAVKPAEEE